MKHAVLALGLILIALAGSLEAQTVTVPTLPATVKVQWDVPPPADNVVRYQLVLDNGPAQVVPATVDPACQCIQTAATILTAGSHTASVTASNYSLYLPNSSTPDPASPLQPSAPMAATFTVAIAQTPPPCTFTVPPGDNFPQEGWPSGGVTFTASALDCPWTITDVPSWLLLTSPTSGTGTASLRYSVPANPGPARTATLTVAGQPFVVNQGGTAAPPPPPPPPPPVDSVNCPVTHPTSLISDLTSKLTLGQTAQVTFVLNAAPGRNITAIVMELGSMQEPVPTSNGLAIGKLYFKPTAKGTFPFNLSLVDTAGCTDRSVRARSVTVK